MDDTVRHMPHRVHYSEHYVLELSESLIIRVAHCSRQLDTVCLNWFNYGLEGE